MGAGKTTVGRAVARRLQRDFIDSDLEIEARTGARIPVIWELEGESGFRQREANVIDEPSRKSGIVLATGGGAVLRPENREHLKNRGIVIYLRANPHDLWQRTRRDKTGRFCRPTTRAASSKRSSEHATRSITSARTSSWKPAGRPSTRSSTWS